MTPNRYSLKTPIYKNGSFKIFKTIEILLLLLILITFLSCDEHEGLVSPDPQPPSSPYQDPVWHPSGEIIGFNHKPIKEIHYYNGYDYPGSARYIYEEDSVGFWLINADGTNQRRVLPYELAMPVWSPDGNWIAFIQKGQTFKMPFDGNEFDTTGIVPLIFEVGKYLTAWSPDGKLIAYHLNDGINPTGLWIKNLEDTTDKFIDPYGSYPSWHPYNDSLIYQTNHLNSTGEDIGDFIWIYDNITDTKQLLVDITSPNYDNRYLQYSPDGTKIAFSSGLNPGGGIYLFTINSDGSGLKKLTSSWTSNFSWSPDGKIVYLMRVKDRIDDIQGTLWIIDANGNNNQQLTHNNFQIIQ
ncbi:MAG: PD40 domain-containing protein [Mariniphaga sp.]|nr:PD40 domain-containing protein [Mariniphaga sp.]